jgi:peptide/nickel transport system permease protein
MGTLAGYFGGWVDTVIMRFCEAMMAIPSMIMAIAMIAVLGQSTRNLIIIMVIGGWVQLCKLTRNNVRIYKSQEFVLASKALGAKGYHIMFRQIFPNVTTQIIVLTSQRVAGVIMMEAGLSYLGLGIPLPAPTWGNMISEGRVYLMTQPWLIIVPGVALMLAVLAFNFLGDGLRDVLDTRRKA